MFLTDAVFKKMFFFSGVVTPGKAKNLKEEENKGLFSMFRKSKKKSEQVRIF